MGVKRVCSGSDRRAGMHGTQASDGRAEQNAEFPSTRYFQVHFEYMEELLREVTLCIEALKQQITAHPRNGENDSLARNYAPLNRNRSAAGMRLSLECDAKKLKKAHKKRASKVAESTDPMLRTGFGE
ncbi:MAG: hypothetical protein L0Y38_09230 [Methylococcaceae bacterium]|nr:hypothetical protein [Methylococcaceae bacterium]MCI0733986.1 hypothetical protein [Methylococcaceae bacterium]